MKKIKGAKVLIFDTDQKVLILRRSATHPFIPFTQDLPGGKIEEHESPLDAACRETHEETQISLEPATLTLAQQRTFSAYNKEYTDYLYTCQLSVRPEVTISWEHDKYEWIELKDVTGLDEGFQPLVNTYRQSQAG